LLYYDFSSSVSQVNSYSSSSVASGTESSGYVATDYDNIILTSNSVTFGDLVQYGGSELYFTIGGFYPTFRTFFRIQIIFTSDPVRAITDASGLAGKTVLAKE
jgi:hypothetical protein